MLHYVCYNDAVIIDVKTFWRPFLLLSLQTVHKNCSYFKLTCTRIQNPYYCERPTVEYMQTRVYWNPYMATLTHTCVSVVLA